MPTIHKLGIGKDFSDAENTGNNWTSQNHLCKVWTDRQ